MNLRDIKIIDLKQSTLDTSEIDELEKTLSAVKAQKEPKSSVLSEMEKKLEKAKENHLERLKNEDFRFTHKVLIDPRFFLRNPDFKIKWGSTIRDGQDLARLRMEGWDFVTSEDQVWPEGAKLTDGKYTFMDMVLLKLPLSLYIEKKKKNRDKHKKRLKSINTKFKSTMRQSGTVGFGGELADDQDITDFL